MCWSYEEEVRVVKCIADRDSEGVNDSGKFHLVESDVRRLYCYELPEGSIREVYLGLRHSALSSQKELRRLVKQITIRHAGVGIKACRLSKETWGIEAASPFETSS